jgi:AcrR family transcriptional regulator
LDVTPDVAADVAGEAVRAPRVERGPYRKGVQRRQEIVRAAAQVFAERGYNGGSLRSIGERVGVSSASLVQYFGTKEGLLAAVLEEWARESRPAGADGLRGLAWLRSMREAMVYNSSRRGLVQLFLTLTAEATNPGHPARAFVQHRYAMVVADHERHLSQAVTDGEVAPMSQTEVEQEARLFVAAMDGMELQWLLDPRVDLLELFDRFLETTLARWAG